MQSILNSLHQNMLSELKSIGHPHLGLDNMRSRSMAIESLLNPPQEERNPPPRYRESRSNSYQSQGSSSPESVGFNRLRQPRQDYDRRRRPLSRSSSIARERREFRPTYLQEEEYFIWYHRVDLGLDWSDVRQAYNAQFPQRQRRGFQGIQCKYYRCCDQYGIPKVRQRSRALTADEAYGVRNRLPGLWYPWMRHPPQQNGIVVLLYVHNKARLADSCCEDGNRVISRSP